METSVFLAQILGPYCIIVGIGMLLNQKTILKVMEDLLKNTALLYLGGAFSLIIGLLIVVSHNIWSADWKVLITLFGWLGILKGVWLMIFPNTTAHLAKAYHKNKSLLGINLCLMLALGGFLTFVGYFAGK
ncbi:MAG: hypothetical protein KKC84_06500 [Candidatus Omnitrophica bacterium]|nr:hypothetical protein [Candidatus Omnitrophota bacterium]